MNLTKTNLKRFNERFSSMYNMLRQVEVPETVGGGGNSPVQFVQINDVRVVYCFLVVYIGEKSAAGSISVFLQWVVPIGRLH